MAKKAKSEQTEEQAAEPKVEQVSFLEIEAKLGTVRKIDVSKIDVAGAKEPDESFVRSVAASNGAIEPVIVMENASGGRFRLIEGRRRVLAHKALIKGDDGKRFEQIDARVYEAGTLSGTEAAVLTLRTNHHRSFNPIAELMAVQAIERGGIKDTKKIAELVGMNVRQVQRLKRLELLVPELREALGDGRMTFDTALKATKLSKAEQADIVEEASDESGQISGASVHAAMEVGPAKGLDKLFTMDLRPTSATRLSAVIAELQKIMAAAGDDAETITKCTAALDALGVTSATV